MNFDNPLTMWGLGATGAVIAWLLRWFHARLETRIATLETKVSELQTQMAGHDANKELLDRMYEKLEALANLTQRIAGHLNIS